MEPYFSDDAVTLWHGDCRELVPALSLSVDLVVADPPYGETSLAWDRWPNEWPAAMVGASRSMWCFGSMRMFLDRRDEFLQWRLSQDVVWRKPRGTSFVSDRFARVHEHALHWYRGDWGSIHHDAPREAHHGRRVQLPQRKGQSEYVHGAMGQKVDWVDDGKRLVRSVLDAPSMHARALHRTEKPVGILDPLIRYGCPEGGLVLDPFAGSGSTAEAARLTGRRVVLIEADERYCEAIARRMSQGVLDLT